VIRAINEKTEAIKYIYKLEKPNKSDTNSAEEVKV
jgi:hypothetical protein